MIWSLTCILPSSAAALSSAMLFTKMPESSSVTEHHECELAKALVTWQQVSAAAATPGIVSNTHHT